jgi:hypothetical protein
VTDSDFLRVAADWYRRDCANWTRMNAIADRLERLDQHQVTMTAPKLDRAGWAKKSAKKARRK